jgi:hypothetical protein
MTRVVLGQRGGVTREAREGLGPLREQHGQFGGVLGDGLLPGVVGGQCRDVVLEAERMRGCHGTGSFMRDVAAQTRSMRLGVWRAGRVAAPRVQDTGRAAARVQLIASGTSRQRRAPGA